MSVKTKYSSAENASQPVEACNGGLAWEPLRLWPPPLYQAYCRTHFIEGCSVYHEFENTRYTKVKSDILRIHPAKSKERGKGSPAPTRAQPSRAKKRPANIPTRTSVEQQVDSTETISITAQREITKLDKQHTKLRLDLCLADFEVGLKREITRISDRQCLIREPEKVKMPKLISESIAINAYQVKQVIPHPNCPFTSWANMKCRYCDFTSRPIGSITPVAPMHLLRYEDFSPKQCGKLGGIRFAVDICGTEEKVVLLSMTMPDGSIEEFKKIPINNKTSMEQKNLAGDLAGESSVRSGGGKQNRSSTTNKLEDDDIGMIKKRRKVSPSPSEGTSMGKAKDIEEPTQNNIFQGKKKRGRPSIRHDAGEETDDDDDDIIIRKRRKL